MKKSYQVLKTGSRSSNLALIQTEDALERLSKLIDNIEFSLSPLSSPGDRDKELDLINSPDDFFTKDLDNAVLSGELDCAIHSAKDMPYPVRSGLDWFWLPWREDPRDVFIIQEGKQLSDLPQKPIIGVSSDRRNNWCKGQFAKAILKPIRGNIEERLAQLDSGSYDLIIMAAAALNRLKLQHRIGGFISEQELTPPDGQGYLSITFREGDERFKAIRSLFIKSVTFTGAGCGRASLCTVEGVQSLKDCDICLYDALVDKELLKNVPISSKSIFVGKRSGKHLATQDHICELIGYYVRQGKKVVRLKGGDPALFGRLKEETDILNNLSIPYKVIPGISALLGATGPAGILLTQRDRNNGFIVATPKREGNRERTLSLKNINNFPIVLFMSVESCGPVLKQYKNDGLDGSTPTAMVFNGSNYDEESIFATIDTLEEKLNNVDRKGRAGLLIIGKSAQNSYKQNLGALAKKKILVTSSASLQEKGIKAVENYGGTAVPFPLIELINNGNITSIIEKLENYEHLILSSPTVITMFFNAIKEHDIDIRSIPQITVSGLESERRLKEFCIKPFAVAQGLDAGASIAQIFKKVEPNQKILRIGSSKCGSHLSKRLMALGFSVEDIHICDNRMVLHDQLPYFDAIIFSSGTAIDSFMTQFGKIELSGKVISLLGTPSQKVLEKYDLNNIPIISKEHSIEGQVFSLANYFINMRMDVLNEQ